MDTWAATVPNATVEGLLDRVGPAAREADGLTVTGGEPFDQPDALAALLRGWRRMSSGDVLVFSGHPLERLHPQLDELSGLIDCLIADPFQSSAGQTLALRGSDNQRLVPLTERGHRLFGQFERRLEQTDRALDVLFDDESGAVFMAGIPRPGDMRRLAGLMAREGHVVATSEDGRVPSC